MREYGRVIVNIAHRDVDEGRIHEYAVARLYRQCDPIVSDVGHVDRILDSDLAGVRVHGEHPELVTAHQSVRDLGCFVFVARLHLQLRLELAGALVHHRAILVLQKTWRTVVRVCQADTQRHARRLALPVVVRRLIERKLTES